MSPDIYNGFRRVLELARSCSSKVFLVLPERLSEKHRTSIGNSFDELFREISTLLAPDHYADRIPTARPRSEEN
jgi:hypothetical protein